VRTGPGEAEPAIAVADDWQGRGVGSVLLGALSERALDEGVTHFNAIVLAANPDAIALLRRLGDASISRHGSELELRIPLASPGRPWKPLRILLRAVANGTLDPALTFWQRMVSRPADDDAPRTNVIVTAIHGDAAESAVALTQSIASAGASRRLSWWRRVTRCSTTAGRSSSARGGLPRGCELTTSTFATSCGPATSRPSCSTSQSRSGRG
jgi:GNAT superfamily N-acetyltransferase